MKELLNKFNLEKGFELILEYGIPVLKALAIYIIGGWLISRSVKLTNKFMEARKYEMTLQKFFINIMTWVLWILLIVAIVGTLGIETSGFAAMLAAMGLAIGLALQGSLSNFAGGVLLLLFKPFRVGDTVEVQGITGIVQEIDILQTKVLMFNRKTAIIPNGPLLNGNIINFDTEGILRCETMIGVSYDADIPKTLEILTKLCTDHPLVLKDPAPVVQVSENAGSSINIIVRPYTLPADMWTVHFYLQQNFKPTLDSIGVEIPYPHQVEIRKKE
ncbi:mechanosensitive ion channel [Nonlabens sp. Ci31]|jgi:small conductance mechanosensitive channel|uniref:mechanosensitive ion channel family protein n=1 Tax=Nonlabens sp. Ci31 TaxID=2608253 RepID=UPI00146381F5|nr:mechanosensitive ion channel domain-containing protein [Nonlabens sp. Ci31]QJP35020.1 mechanosensitive ion channel [Nonlabens sp. Ci31]